MKFFEVKEDMKVCSFCFGLGFVVVYVGKVFKIKRGVFMLVLVF